ncbi:MAG: zinc-dependent metalloprotease [Flavobacteriaceae bacterium]|nr:zinc-dependent metalloprotease [Flavobacteriaceae bacterium]
MKLLFKTLFILWFSISYSQSITENFKTYNGFFNFYYDDSSDKIYLEISDLDKEFLYISSLSSGLGSNDIGLDRGQLGNERLVKFSKYGDKILLIQPNLRYRAVSENELEKRSVEQAFAKSVIYGFKIAEQKDNKYIVDFTSFLMEDRHGVAKRLKNTNQGSYKVDKSKSAIELERTKAFPENVEFEALLTFSGDAKGRLVSSVSPDADRISVIQHHSFIKLPDGNYNPREFDVRSGAISISFMDYATPVYEPIIKRYITRHRLEKKDTTSDYSEAKEPIVYYLDPGTPEPIKSALLEGASWWNQAYEAIGFKNAFQVKMLPKDADPMDCRYNVIQWVHRSTRGWSYGSSVVDPRTGEIIKGHVSLGSLRIRQDFSIAQALLNKPYLERDNHNPMLEMALARIRQLSAHEVGHTLGFVHNFAASTKDRASVMDYPHPLISIDNNKINLDNAYDEGIGEWDKITVAYSYSDFNKSIDENQTLNKILDDAHSSGLRFITDSDARAIGGAHSLGHLWDNGESASVGLEDIIKARNKAITNFSEYNIQEKQPFSVLEDVFVPLYFLHRYQTEAAVKLIGGLEYNYATRGDNQTTVKQIDYLQQNKALNSVLKTINATFLSIPKSKINLFPPRAFGYPRSRESFKSMMGVGFDPISIASTASDMTFSLLLHPERMNRLILQKSLNNSSLGISEVFDRLISYTFKVNNNDLYINEIQQTVNHKALEYLINLVVSDDCLFQVKDAANKAIGSIEKLLSSKAYKDFAYSSYYKDLIKNFKSNPEKYVMSKSLKIPDGSPIGSSECSYIN